MTSIKHVCPIGRQGVRLDVFVLELFPGHSRTAVQEWIRQGHVMVDGRRGRPGERVLRGMEVQVEMPLPVSEEGILQAEDIPLCVLYEDAEMLVIDKPAGMAVHPGAGLLTGTVANALAGYLRSSRVAAGNDLRMGIVHRLDKDTSGLLVLAKTPAAQWRLSRSFADRTVHKHYLALVLRSPRPASGRIDLPVCRHPLHRTRMAIARQGEGRPATTLYRTLATTPSATLLECKLLTGRTHQIRVHLQALGCPILGDKVYNPQGPPGFPRQMLHAWRLAIPHPITQKYLTFTSEPPRDFLESAEVDWGEILCTSSNKRST